MTIEDLRLRTTDPLSEDDIAQLAGLGLRVVDRLPDGGYRVRGVTAAAPADVLALSNIRDVSTFDPIEKLDPTLAAGVTGGAAVAGVGALGDSGAPLDRVAEQAVDVLVTLDQTIDTAETTTALGGVGEVGEASARRAVVHTTTGRLADLAAVPGVLRAEVLPDVTTQNNIARGLTRAEPISTTLGLDGAGEIVGVADSGLDTGVPATVLADFAGRVVNIRATVTKLPANGADLNNHGTHVCGSIAGDGANSNGTLRGMAPGARLTVLSMGPNNSSGLSVPADLVTGVFTDAYGDGARIHSNSWGSNNNLGKYTAFSEDVDDFVFNHPDMLVVIAAGNSGPGASTVSAPGTAKNCLTVGAAESVRPLPAAISINPNLQDADHNPATLKVNVPLTLNGIAGQADNASDIATFSSRGPVNDTGDTRTKPDIVAPGSFILSCRSTVSTADRGPDGLAHDPNVDSFYADDADGVATHAEAVGRGLPGAPFFGTWNETTPPAPAGSGPLAQQNYFYDSGTSMATPITSGGVAILRQYLRQRRGLANPSAALMKAMIVNAAAVPGGGPAAPDNTRGFGWLDVQQMLTPPGAGQQSFSDDVQLAVATGEIRTMSVTVADPGQPLRITLVWTDRPGKGLQNRLYLRVVAPGGGAAVDGDVTAFPTVTNNVQRVHIAAPVAGTYTVQVHGLSVPFGIPALAPALRQDFALAISNGVGFSPEPVDVVEVVDRSGSMGFYNFMTPARERSKQLIDVLRISDRAGVVMFDHAPATVSPVVPIAGAATQDALTTAIDTITPAGATSIGAGLQQAVGDLAAGGDATHPQAIVLLSDGHENTPPWVGGGLTNSPPSWYSGPDFTEALPSVPATTKVYTVSLGVASDEILLAGIAAARGGLFQSVHSAADNGKLHEIYVHLQALVGGEQVIAAGSDEVDGIGGLVPGPQDLAAVASDRPELIGLLSPTSPLGEAIRHARKLQNMHSALIDDTVSSAAFVVSWHDPTRPVELTLTSPSAAVITAATPGNVVTTGSSYLVIRIDAPEPGEWTLRVGARDAKGPHGYTWGVHGESPFGLQIAPPAKSVGAGKLTLRARLDDPDKLTRSPRFSGTVAVPLISIDDVITKHRDELDRVDLRDKPDTPDLDPNLAKLPLLEQALVGSGKPSLFDSSTSALNFRGRSTTRTATFSSAVPGTSAVDVSVTGVTAGGHRFSRIARCDIPG
ncbi:S8 family serine peptidase [Nakamurella sp. GG22]